MDSGILAPWPGIESGTMAMEVPSPSHWTARELPLPLSGGRKFIKALVNNFSPGKKSQFLDFL